LICHSNSLASALASMRRPSIVNHPPEVAIDTLPPVVLRKVSCFFLSSPFERLRGHHHSWDYAHSPENPLSAPFQAPKTWNPAVHDRHDDQTRCPQRLAPLRSQCTSISYCKHLPLTQRRPSHVTRAPILTPPRACLYRSFEALHLWGLGTKVVAQTGSLRLPLRLAEHGTVLRPQSRDHW
jgi:hypothetical protein